MHKYLGILAAVVFAAGQVVQAESARMAVSTNYTSVFSPDRLFYAAGGSSVDNLQVATFAGKVQKDVAKQLGAPIPRFSGNPVLLTLRTQAGTWPRVDRFQTYEHRSLQQEILIINPARVDQEQLLEAITWCLVNRYGIIRQPAEHREENPVDCPEWLSAGVSQLLFPLSKHRNRRLLTQILPGQSIHAIEHILEWIRLPDHRAVTHAECAAHVQWLITEDAEFLAHALQRLSAGGGLGLDWVQAQCGAGSVRELMMRRDLWLARDLFSYIDLAPYQAEDLRNLQSLMNLERPLFGLFVDSEGSENLNLAALIRSLPASPGYETLRLLERELGKLNAGKFGDLHVWSGKFIQFLDEILSSESVAGRGEDWLGQMQALEQERRELMSAWLEQDRYLDTFEKRK